MPQIISDLPSPFVRAWLARVPQLVSSPSVRALDLAMGRGRHTIELARAGFEVYGVDWRLDAVRDARDRAKHEKLDIHVWCADLTMILLPESRFELVVVTRYLDRMLFPALRASVRPGGIVIYETFTVNQRRLGTGPTSPAHLLEPGELHQCFEGFETVFYEETLTPEAVARIVSRRPRSNG